MDICVASIYYRTNYYSLLLVIKTNVLLPHEYVILIKFECPVCLGLVCLLLAIFILFGFHALRTNSITIVITITELIPLLVVGVFALTCCLLNKYIIEIYSY